MEKETIQFYAESLQNEMKTQLDQISKDHVDQLVRYPKSLELVRLVLIKLKEGVKEYTFSNEVEEIQFFKEIKPVFLSQYYLYKKLFFIKLNEPFSNVSKYYTDALTEIQNFQTKHLEFYSYCVSGCTHLDMTYFIRSRSVEEPDRDISFSTYYDRLLAIILANHMLKEFYLEEIGRLSNNSRSAMMSTLEWTATKTSLIELVYALKSVDAINHGKVDIKELASLFEKMFNINLGNFYRQFQEIRLRKKAKTPFLDSLKVTLEKRLDEF